MAVNETHEFKSEHERKYNEALVRAGRGMSLHDYFYAKACAAVIAHTSLKDIAAQARAEQMTPAQWVARQGRDIADAMIAERRR